MWRLACAIALTVFTLAPLRALATAEDGQFLAGAIVAIKENDWANAESLARQANNPAATTYVTWRRLRAGKGTWSAYSRFLREHSDWPGLPLLRKTGESAIPDGRPSEEIIAYFGDTAPQSGAGALRLASALLAQERSEEAYAVIKTAWETLWLSDSERREMLRLYPKTLAKSHWVRADQMIWDGKFDQAEAIKSLLSGGQQRLLDARIALRRGKNGVTKLIDAVPRDLKNDPGLAYDRFRWRLRRDLWSGGEEILFARSKDRASLGRPEIWSHRRAMTARKAMREKRYDTAYKIASSHQLRQSEKGYIDLEWLSGYLKLIYLKDAEAAIYHFRNLRRRAKTPITQGRVWYWLGRAHEAEGNEEKAKEAYEIAAGYQTSFYGQLAASRGGFASDAGLANLVMPNWQGAPFLTSSVFQAGVLLHHAGERYEGGRFFAHLAETMSEAEQAQLGQYLVDIKRPNMALRVAKNAAAMGRVTIHSYYPVTELADIEGGVPPELVMAIARQETELNPDVTSPVGALGLMQVMPRTAKAMAGKLSIPYQKDRLKTDWRYNATLGIAYLKELLNRYDGSFVLTAAAYNAGPSRVKRWIEEHGDPRRRNVNTEQWIEKIQFNETRNYVQRVLESVNVYRARLTGSVDGFQLAQDLARGR